MNENNIFGKFVLKTEKGIHKAGSKIGREFCSQLLPPLLGMGRRQDRLQLFLTNAELSRIKCLATPLPGNAGDGWVSTQEAVVAHLTLSLWKSLHCEVRAGGTACVSFLVDIRKYLNIS